MSAFGLIAVIIVATVCTVTVLLAIAIAVAMIRMPDEETTWSYGEADQ